MTKLLVLFLTFLIANRSFAQIVFNKVDNEQAKSTILKLNNYILSKPVPDYKVNGEDPFRFLGAEGYTDSIINLFYDRRKMDSAFLQIENSKPTGQSRYVMMSLQRISLSVFSKTLHCIPQDSIYVMGMEEYYRINKLEKEKGETGLENSYIAGFITKNNLNDFFTIFLNEDGTKIIMIVPIIQFEMDNRAEREEFLKRHCGN